MPNPDTFPSTYSPPTNSRLDYFYDRPGTTPGKLNVLADAPPADLVLIDYNCDRSDRVTIKLLTVQEEPEEDCFDGVRKRIESDRGIIRKQGADYLAYCLLELMAIVAGCLVVCFWKRGWFKSTV
jgi:hypothetical protein